MLPLAASQQLSRGHFLLVPTSPSARLSWGTTVFGYQPVPEWMGLDEVPGGRHLTTTIDLGPSLSGSGRGALGGGFVVGGVYRAELPSGYEFT